MKTPGKILPLIAAALLYPSAACAAAVTDSVNIYSADGSLISTCAFSPPEIKENDPLAQVSALYLNMKHRRFLQRCKSLETDMNLIYEAWKAGAGENDSFGKSGSRNSPSAGGKSLQSSGSSYSMTTELFRSPLRKTASLVTKEISSIIGQRNVTTYAATFDAATGRRLSLADAFGGDKAVADKIAVYVQRYLVASPYKDNLAPDYNSHVYDFCTGTVEDGWYIDGDNLTVIYPASAITKNHDSELLVTLPLKELIKI